MGHYERLKWRARPSGRNRPHFSRTRSFGWYLKAATADWSGWRFSSAPNRYAGYGYGLPNCTLKVCGTEARAEVRDGSAIEWDDPAPQDTR